MAKFKIIHTEKNPESEINDFYVQFIEGILNSGDEFTTYDTHHPVKWTIEEVLSKSNDYLLRCKNRLGLFWDDQFAGAIVDTCATQKSDAYKYPPMTK